MTLHKGAVGLEMTWRDVSVFNISIQYSIFILIFPLGIPVPPLTCDGVKRLNTSGSPAPCPFLSLLMCRNNSVPLPVMFFIYPVQLDHSSSLLVPPEPFFPSQLPATPYHSLSRRHVVLSTSISPFSILSSDLV